MAALDLVGYYIREKRKADSESEINTSRALETASKGWAKTAVFGETGAAVTTEQAC